MIRDIWSIYNDNQVLHESYPGNLKSLRFQVQNQAAEKLGIHTSPDEKLPALVVTGHQVEFFHPGILSKEILGANLAARLGGSCISIVLDHDPHDLIFHCPEVEKINGEIRIRKTSFFLNSKNPSVNAPGDDTRWVQYLKKIPGNLSEHLEDQIIGQIRENISGLVGNSAKMYPVSDYITNCRLESLRNRQINVYPLKVSEMVYLDGWAWYCRMITEDLDLFIEAHNSSLDEYRRLHHIKNHAQPVSNLAPKEIPFWVIPPDGKRRKATEEDLGRMTLYPRAITLSIFLRLFFSDIFIHGTGGARYDRVTNSIIQKFFGVVPSTFLVKTANLKLPVKPGGPLEKYKNVQSLEDWSTRYRFFHFHPERVPGVAPDLVKQRSDLIREFHECSGSRKRIHDALESNRLAILSCLADYEDRFLQEKEEIKEVSIDHGVLLDRTFPYFFYDLTELLFDQDYGVVGYGK